MQGQPACRAGEPSGQGEEPPPEGLGGGYPLSQTDPRRPAAIVTTDALRVHEQFIENQSAVECHIRVMQTLEMLALVNSLRHLVQSDQGLTALANTGIDRLG